MPAFSIDSRSLRLFRIGLGLIVLWDLFDRSHVLTAHYVDGGVFTATPGSGFLSFHGLWGSFSGQALFMALHALFAVAMIINHRPRLSAILTFLFTVSLQNRNPLVLYGADDVLRLMLLFSLFLPFPSGGPPQQIRGAGSVALLTQVVVIFLCAGLHKLGNSDWRAGTALVDSVYAFPGVASHFVVSRPLTFEVFNYFVMGLQLAAPLALLPATRALILGLFWCLQIGMALTMSLAMFPFVVAVAWLPFLPTGFWTALKKLKPTPAPSLNRRTAWVVFLLCGVIIPLGGEMADTIGFRTRLFDVYVALSLRQHWRMFTPPPRMVMWTSFYGQNSQGELFDLITGKPFKLLNSGDEAPWGGTRWVNLTQAMARHADVSENVVKYICRQAPLRYIHQKTFSHSLGHWGQDPNTWVIHPGASYACPDHDHRLGSL